ncbi:MAG: serine/threonine-protein kinase, partial [Myxococcota bacterium]
MHDDATLPELEEYQRIAPIGQGGQGRVWRAKHRVSGREVALKVATGEEAPRLGVEAQLLASLRHPHVIDVLDWGHEQDVVWAVFELGKSGLRERGPAAPGIAERVLLEILDALAHVHARGILHLDVKPDNVVLGCRRRDDEPLIDDFDGLRLLDFGISVDRARAFQWASSPGFAAPEIQSGTWSRVGAWTDLYSVGRLAAWLVTGTTELPDDWTTPFARWVRRLLADDWRE